MSGIVVDESQLPICIVRWSGKPTQEDFEAYLTRMTEMITATVPPARVTIHDATGHVMTPATFRGQTAEWMARYEDDIRRAALGIGFVFDNTLMRGMLTAVFWMQPMPVTHRLCATMPEAMEWANELLIEAGVTGRRTEHLFRPRGDTRTG